MLVFIPPSVSFSHTKWFSFLQLKRTKLTPSKWSCKDFPKAVFAAKLTQATKKGKWASVYRSVPLFPETKSKELGWRWRLFLTTHSRRHSLNWVSSYRKNCWLRHTHTLSTAYTEVQRCCLAALGRKTLPKHPDILWETLEETVWLCTTN